MIICIAGTNGSGKSTVVRKVMKMADRTGVIGKIERPSAYDLNFVGVSRSVRVVGCYVETLMAAGCDAQRDIPQNYEAIALAVKEGRHVIYEGIRMMGHTSGIQLYKDMGVSFTVVLLDTTLETCVTSINERRKARGSDKTAHSKDIESNIKRASNFAFKLSELGAKRVKVSRDDAPETILKLLQGAT